MFELVTGPIAGVLFRFFRRNWTHGTRLVFVHFGEIALPHLLEACLFRQGCALHVTSVSRFDSDAMPHATVSTTRQPIMLYQR